VPYIVENLIGLFKYEKIYSYEHSIFCKLGVMFFPNDIPWVMSIHWLSCGKNQNMRSFFTLNKTSDKRHCENQAMFECHLA